jgi:DNA-binding MarR family transcriptional regulator
MIWTMPDKSMPAQPSTGGDMLSDSAIETSRLLMEFLQAAYAVRNETENGSPGSGHEMDGAPAGGMRPPMSDHAIRAAVHVYQHGERTVGQLASGLGISYGWASRVVEELEAAHFLVRSRDPHDRRVVHVRLDPAALERVEHAYRWRGRAVEQALAPLSEAEQQGVRLFLRRVIDLLRDNQAARG